MGRDNSSPCLSEGGAIFNTTFSCIVLLKRTLLTFWGSSALLDVSMSDASEKHVSSTLQLRSSDTVV